MSFVNTKGKFHVALDGVGLLLQGAPDRNAYKMSNAPVYGTRFASGDRDYNDLSQWWYLTQTDWSGGFKDDKSFDDDAKYYYSSNIDAYSKPGSIQLEKSIAQYVALALGTGDEVFDVKYLSFVDSAGSDRNQLLAITNSGAVDITYGTPVLFASENNDQNFVMSHRGYIWGLGDSITWTNAPTSSLPLSTLTERKSNVQSVITGTIDKAYCGVSVGDTLYVFGKATNGKMWCAKTSAAAPTTDGEWTKVFEITPEDTYGGQMAGAVLYENKIIFMTTAEDIWCLYSLDVSTGVVTLMNTFVGGSQISNNYRGAKYVRLFNGGVLITVVYDDDYGKGEVWFWDGNTLEQIYKTDKDKDAMSTEEPITFLTGGATILGNRAYWGNLIYDGTHFYNGSKTVDDSLTYPTEILGTDGVYIYTTDWRETGGDKHSVISRFDPNGTTYKGGANHSAFLVCSQYDKLQSIDKLLNTFTIGFEKLLTGQEINVYYTTNPVPDPNITTGGWALLGSATYAADGGSVVSKVLKFPEGTIAKKVWIRIELVSPTAGTPVLIDKTLEYLPMPEYKKQWTFYANCGNEVKKLDGRLVETTARELKSRIEKMWWTKSGLDFQDVDYATTLLNGSLTSTATTITVDSTVDFPEQGRIKIDNEEILYTGKTPTTFTGCIRGSRGTLGAAHSDNAVVNNAYKVIIIGLEESVPIILQDKQLEYIVGITIREI